MSVCANRNPETAAINGTRTSAPHLQRLENSTRVNFHTAMPNYTLDER